MTLGTMATDCEIRIDYDKLRKERLSRANDQLKKDGLGALLCFDPDAIRYITSTRLGEGTGRIISWHGLVCWRQIRNPSFMK